MPKSQSDMLKRIQDQVLELQRHIAKLERKPLKRQKQKAEVKRPFPGFERLASGDRKGSLKIIRAQSPEALRAGIKAEKAGRGRKQVTAWMKETLGRLEAGLPATPRRGRPTTSKPGRRVKRTGRAKPSPARRGRPALSEKPHQMKGRSPVKGFESWSITSKDPANNMRRQIVALQDPRQVKSLLAFERRQPHPRSTVVHLLERRLRALQGGKFRGGKVAHPGKAVPFPGYEKVASSRQRESRRILAARSLPELQKALEYERSQVGRVQVEEMIEAAISNKQASARRLPFPGYDKVASANLTLTRRLLRGASDSELKAARAYEEAGRNRVQVLRAIDAEVKQRSRPAGRRGRPPAGRLRVAARPKKPAAKPEPFPGFGSLASGDRKGSLKIIRAQSPEALRAGIKAEKAGRGRKQVTAWMQETLGRLEAGLPATPRRGRPEKPLQGRQPFPGYEQVSTSDITGARRILSSRSPKELQKALRFEREEGKGRSTIIALEEKLIASKGMPTPTGKPPFEDYDALPQGVICRTLEKGMLDDQLDQIIAYEQSTGRRKPVIKAAKARKQGKVGSASPQLVA